MTSSDWIAKAKEHADSLRSLLGNYHPASAEYAREWGHRKQRITAAAAEGVCAMIREQIKQQDADKEHPIARFDAALEKGDMMEILGLLNAAWFGVPESTSCWAIPGFRQAVSLLEDLPEEDEPEQ